MLIASLLLHEPTVATSLPHGFTLEILAFQNLAFPLLRRFLQLVAFPHRNKRHADVATPEIVVDGRNFETQAK